MLGTRLIVVALALLLVSLVSACARQTILPLCEGALYLGEAHGDLQAALASLDAGDLATYGAHVDAAEAHMDSVDRRLDEATRGNADGYEDWLTAFSAASSQTRAIVAAMATPDGLDRTFVKESLGIAADLVRAMGPAADCALREDG